MDDDLQNPPSEVLDFSPSSAMTLTLCTAPGRRPQSGCATRLRWDGALGMSRPEVNDKMSAFRVLRRRLLDGSQLSDDPYVSIDVLLSWATSRVAVVEVEFARREAGVSGYTLSKLVRHAFNMVTGYSSRPLRAVSALGFVISSFGFALLLYALGRFIIEPTDVEGFTFLAVAISLFSGVQLLSLGMVGEYLARMHFRTMGRPAYAVRDEIGGAGTAD